MREIKRNSFLSRKKDVREIGETKKKRERKWKNNALLKKRRFLLITTKCYEG